MVVVPLAKRSQRCPVFSPLCTLMWLGLSWFSFCPQLRAEVLEQWSFNPKTYQLRFTAQSEPESFLLENPTRIVIDIPDVTWEGKTVDKTYGGLVRAVRIAQFQPEITRIVLELSPEAKLLSQNVNFEKNSTPQGNEWQLTPRLKKIHFPLSKLLQMPPVTPQPPTLPVTVEVPSPPSITKERSSQLQQPSPTLSQKRTFSLRDRGKNPLTLEVGEQGQEIFFLKNALETHKSNVTYSRKLPVLGDLETIFPRTRCIPVIPSVQLFLGEQTYSVIPIEADSNFCATPISSQFSKITIHSNTVFNFTLTEDLHHNNETDH